MRTDHSGRIYLVPGVDTQGQDPDYKPGTVLGPRDTAARETGPAFNLREECVSTRSSGKG